MQNSATLDATYHYYYNGQQNVETRNGSDLVIKQNVWGLTYIDELVQTSLNDDPADLTEQLCESNFYAMQDANYNVLGMIDATGILIERYEYTPYGQRQVYTSSGLNDPLCYAPISTSKPWQIAGTSGITQPYSLNATGHQGLFHDEEINLIYNRARMLNPRIGRFIQREPLGYVDGMSLYQYVKSRPIYWVDPTGHQGIGLPVMPVPVTPSPVTPGPLWPTTPAPMPIPLPRGGPIAAAIVVAIISEQVGEKIGEEITDYSDEPWMDIGPAPHVIQINTQKKRMQKEKDKCEDKCPLGWHKGDGFNKGLSAQQALARSFPGGKLGPRKNATSCGAGGGSHWNVKHRINGRFLGSIKSCNLCDDVPPPARFFSGTRTRVD